MTSTDAVPGPAERSLLDAVSVTLGHFHYESGHHGDLWLDLDALLLNPGKTRLWAAALAARAAACAPDLVCGPLTGGAFVAQLVAAELGTRFVYSERRIAAGTVTYPISSSLRPALAGARVLLVDDAVNAGSALLATRAGLEECGAETVGFASLLVLGEAAPRIEDEYGLPFFALATLERRLWTPEACPLCRAGTPLRELVPG